MSYPPKKFDNKQDFFQDRLPMAIGSICNLYSNTDNHPSPDEIFGEAVKMVDKIWSFGQRFDPFPELDAKLLEKFNQENVRKIGRYHSSELWGLLNGKVPPSKFLEPKTFTQDEMKRMYWGTIIHEGIQKLFNFEENKYELKISDDVVIVGKIDLELGKDNIFEFKSREDIETFDDLPNWYLYQCWCYMEMKNIDKMKLYFFGWGFSRRLFIVNRQPELFEDLKAGLLDYHNRVVKAYAKK